MAPKRQDKRPYSPLVLLTAALTTTAAADRLAPQKSATTFTTPTAFSLNLDPDAPLQDAILHGFSSEGWETAFLKANATGFANITGYDMSTTYPGSRSPEEWQDSVQTRTGVNFTGDWNPGLATGIWLRTHAPASLLRPAKFSNGTTIQTLPQDRDAWQLCPLIFAGPKLRSKTPLSGPGCAPFLSEQCIADWQEKLRKTFLGEEGGGRQLQDPSTLKDPVRCPLPSSSDIPSSCNETGLFENSIAFRSRFNEVGLTFSDNATGLIDMREAPLLPTNGTFEMFMFTINKPITDGRMYAGRMEAELAEATERVFVMAHIWGTPGKFWGNKTAPSPQATAQVACLQANGRVLANDDATGGGGDGADKNGGTFIRPSSSSWMLVVAALVWARMVSFL